MFVIIECIFVLLQLDGPLVEVWGSQWLERNFKNFVSMFFESCDVIISLGFRFEVKLPKNESNDGHNEGYKILNH